MVENSQRDINIALMNEGAMICDRIGMRTADSERAASPDASVLRRYRSKPWLTPALV